MRGVDNLLTKKMQKEVIDLCSDEESKYIPPAKKRKVSNDAACAREADASGWQPFYLTKVCGIENPYNNNSLSFQDLICQDEHNPIDEACFMNYMMDLSWMVSLCPFLLTCKTLIVHGSTVEQLRHPNWIISKVDMGMERYGTHHSKMAFLFYSTGVRIVITTANFIPEDFSFRTQATYVQDFPPKASSEVAGSEFEQSLVDYLDKVSVSERAQQRLVGICQRLRAYDFTAAEVTLVASVPGRHTTHKDKWGLGKLCKELSKADSCGDRWRDYKLVMQCSSLGSMGPEGKLLHDYARRMMCPQSAKKASVEDFELVWPTVECVRTSLQGYESGNSLPCNTKTLYRADGKNLLPGFANRLYQWDGLVSGRERATPHMKCYFRYALQEGQVHLSWFFLTSSNMSQAAFGVFQSNDSQLYIKSYEMGVLYLPNKLKTVHRTFTCTPSHPILGRIGGTSSSIMETRFVAANSTVQGSGEQYVGFPIPFVLPPEPYSKDDVPWVWDRGFSAPDVLGRRKVLS
ncbi:hypothetical protein EON65_05415 [archaeon]|nr:MAG: hypothetical protein EON65_05415 [archaeon]